MSDVVRLMSLLTATCVTASVSAQQPNFPPPEKEHAFLKKFAGTWESASDCTMAPGQTPMKTTATSTNRMIGEFWLVNEIKSTGGGAKVTAFQTIGYDPAKKKYFGTWVDSMFGHMWHYEGTVSEDKTTLTLEADGPNFMTGKGTTKFRDVYRFETADHIVASAFVMGEDGKWVEFVSGHSRRVKSPNRPSPK